MKMLFAALLFAGVSASASDLTFNVRCNVTDSLKTVVVPEIASVIDCRSTQRDGSGKVAELTLQAPFSVTIAGNTWQVTSVSNTYEFKACAQALADTKRLVSFNIKDAETDQTYSLQIMASNNIRIGNANQACSGKLIP